MIGGSPEVRPAHWAKPGPKPKPFNPDNCGTRPGYNSHRKHGIPLCEPCRAANAKHCADGREKRKARAT